MSCMEHRSSGSAWTEIIRKEITHKDVTQHPLTSSQYFRSTDLPSLRTQSSILVLMPFPQTAFSLSWHVLQSERKGARQNRRPQGTQILSGTPYLNDLNSIFNSQLLLSCTIILHAERKSPGSEHFRSQMELPGLHRTTSIILEGRCPFDHLGDVVKMALACRSNVT